MSPFAPAGAPRSLGVVLAAALAAAALSACAPTSTPAPGTIPVVGAESQYASVLREVGGAYVTVTAVLTSPFVDPHSFEAGTPVARAVANARVVVQNGMGYDDFMGQLESATSSAHRQVLVVQRLVGAPRSGFNPHLWYAPRTMPIVAAAIERALAAAAPEHASYFAANLRRVDAQLAAWTATVAAFRSAHSGLTAVTTEPVANYLLGAMGIRVVTPRQFQADVMNGVDPAPQDIDRVERLLRSGSVTIYCVNQQVTDTVTSSLTDIARTSSVPVVGVYEVMPRRLDYVGWMNLATSQIARAATGTAAP